ncbi:MAG: methyltransferase domain-containing protein [Candidatus Jettenia sp. CY-1]|nr:MAG: methyltransferase domain-containing protein [Candidatus Jettenia sp. CY-1]
MQLPFHDNSFNFGIMQAFLTVLFEPEEHIEVLKESSRVLKPKGKLYISEFCKTWDSPKYRERYIAGFEVTGYVATFPVLDAYSNRILYYAHHFSEHELFDILNYAGFNVIQSRNTKFLTKSGNTINGIVIIAQNKKI